MLMIAPLGIQKTRVLAACSKIIWVRNWLTDYFGSCCYSSNMTGELFDIYYGIKLVRELGYPVVICESDSKMTLQFIKDGVANHHPHASGIHAIRGLQQLTWYVSFQHTIREGNYAVDALAK